MKLKKLSRNLSRNCYCSLLKIFTCVLFLLFIINCCYCTLIVEESVQDNVNKNVSLVNKNQLFLRTKHFGKSLKKMESIN